VHHIEEPVIAEKHTLSAKKIEEQKAKRLANQKRGKKEKRAQRRDARDD
jgi:hypothetical protein